MEKEEKEYPCKDGLGKTKSCQLSPLFCDEMYYTLTRGDQCAPLPVKTTMIVRTSILISSRMDMFSK